MFDNYVSSLDAEMVAWSLPSLSLYIYVLLFVLFVCFFFMEARPILMDRAICAKVQSLERAVTELQKQVSTPTSPIMSGDTTGLSQPFEGCAKCRADNEQCLWFGKHVLVLAFCLVFVF